MSGGSLKRGRGWGVGVLKEGKRGGNEERLLPIRIRNDVKDDDDDDHGDDDDLDDQRPGS
eukprot:759306-Hanusia_phi.AAC.1